MRLWSVREGVGDAVKAKEHQGETPSMSRWSKMRMMPNVKGQQGSESPVECQDTSRAGHRGYLGDWICSATAGKDLNLRLAHEIARNPNGRFRSFFEDARPDRSQGDLSARYVRRSREQTHNFDRAIKCREFCRLQAWCSESSGPLGPRVRERRLEVTVSLPAKIQGDWSKKSGTPNKNRHDDKLQRVGVFYFFSCCAIKCRLNKIPLLPKASQYRRKLIPAGGDAPDDPLPRNSWRQMMDVTFARGNCRL